MPQTYGKKLLGMPTLTAYGNRSVKHGDIQHSRADKYNGLER